MKKVFSGLAGAALLCLGVGWVFDGFNSIIGRSQSVQPIKEMTLGAGLAGLGGGMLPGVLGILGKNQQSQPDNEKKSSDK